MSLIPSSDEAPRRWRRRLWQLHVLLVLGLGILFMSEIWPRFSPPLESYDPFRNLVYYFILCIPFLLHTLYFTFREAHDRGFNRGFHQGQYETLLDREDKRKRDHALIYLSDDGELVDYDEDADDAYPPRRKRG
jgi:hypothetical protein